MGETEEYLDDLLHSLSDDADADQVNTEDIIPQLEETDETEEQFLKQFEEELAQDDADQDFLKELEDGFKAQEEIGEQEVTPQVADLGEPAVSEIQSAEINPDTNGGESSGDDDLMALLAGLAEDPELNFASEEEQTSQPESEIQMPDESMDKMESVEAVTENAEVSAAGADEIKQSADDSFGLSSMDIFGDEDIDILTSSAEEVTETKEKKSKNKKDKKQGNGEKQGFLQKISLVLFGEDEEESLTEEEKLLQSKEAEKEKELKEKKKQEKAEAKAKKKEEKAAKKAEKKANKPKKEKKPKVPKEKDNTPPLPKKPIILMAIMSISILALVLLGSHAVGYTVARGEAKEAYKSGDYVTAYAKLAGYSIKEKDEEFFAQVGLLATLQEQYNAYQTMMSLGNYEMALDCLVRGIGRYDKNLDDATEYGVAPEYNTLKQQMAEELFNTFGVDEEKAREIYGQRGRKRYTIEIKKVLMSMGMELEFV